MRLPDSILQVLQDGEPHRALELAERTKVTIQELDRVMNFLVKYGFCGQARRVRADRFAVRLLVREL